MVQQLTRCLALAVPILVMAGCGHAEEDPAAVAPTPASKAAVESSNSAWTPEKQEAFRSALSRAHTGQEGGGAPGQSAGGGSQTPTSSSMPSGETNVQAPSASSPSPASPASSRPQDTQMASDGSGVVIGK